MKKKTKPGPKASGGPRVQVRFKTDADITAIERAVLKINEAAEYGQNVTFNSFVAAVAVSAAREVLQGSA